MMPLGMFGSLPRLFAFVLDICLCYEGGFYTDHLCPADARRRGPKGAGRRLEVSRALPIAVWKGLAFTAED